MVKKIQTWWRGILQRRHYAKLLEKKLKKGQGEMYKISSVKCKNQSTMEWYKEQVTLLINNIIIYHIFCALLKIDAKGNDKNLFL